MSKVVDSLKKIVKENYKDFLIVIILVILIRGFIMSPYRVFGPSMCDTLNAYSGACNHGKGEYIIVNKFLYFFSEPKRGDIIVFEKPYGNGEDFIKRIIGLPGETVILKDGYVYIKENENTKPYKLDEIYLNSENFGHTDAFLETEFVVPKNSYFVMGDNRRESLDSRASFSDSFTQLNKTPFVPKKNIEGKASIILLPFSELGFMH
jgi:signal peptidase I